MISRKQAQIVADELLADARARREAKLARRTRRLVWRYPELRQLPATQRFAALRNTRQCAESHWTARVSIVLVILAFATYLGLDAFGAEATSRFFGWTAGVLFVSHHLLIRFYIRQLLHRAASRAHVASISDD
jgi:hypothetical protein